MRSARGVLVKFLAARAEKAVRGLQVVGSPARAA